MAEHEESLIDRICRLEAEKATLVRQLEQREAYVADLQRWLRQCSVHSSRTAGGDGDVKKIGVAMGTKFEDIPDDVNDCVAELECDVAQRDDELDQLEKFMRFYGAGGREITLPSPMTAESVATHTAYGWTICIPWTEQPMDFLTRPVNDVERTRYFPSFSAALRHAVQERWVHFPEKS